MWYNNWVSMKEKTGGKFRSKCLIFGIITLVIFATINIWGFFYFSTNVVAGSKTFYELLNPARGIIKQEDLIVNFQPLRDYLNNKYESDADVSVYFEFLNTGANISIGKDAEFYPASLLKVPVAMAVAKKIERGEWQWINELVLLSADRDKKFGDLYKQPTGSTFTIEELVKKSLQESDNTAHFILVRNLEMSEIQDVYDHMGLYDFMTTDGKISAKKYSVIFRALYNSSYNTAENSSKMLGYLANSKFDNYIKSALPADIKLAHKIGTSEDQGVYLDSGVIYFPGRPYLLTVMIRAFDEKIATAKIKDISEKVYKYIKEFEQK